MCCFCWASKLLSGISDALQPVSIGLRNCHLARFQHPLKALKPSQQLCHGTSRGLANCFCWPSKLQSAPSEVPQLPIGLRNRHLFFSSTLKSLTTFKTFPAALPWAPRPHELFLLGFEAAIWHFRGTTTFYRASKLPSGTFPAPLKSLKTLPAALPWDFPRPQELFLLAFEAAIWHFQGATTFYRASKLPSGTFPALLKSLKTLPAALPWDFPRPRELFLLAFEAAIWPFRGATTFYWASKPPSGLFQHP